MKNERAIRSVLIIGIVAVAIVAVMVFTLDQHFTLKPYKPTAQNNSANYVAWITPAAIKTGRKYGIPHEFIVVQTALESGWGKSNLLSKYNNFGGIKAVKGDKSVNLPTQEFLGGQMVTINDGFAVYKNPSDGLDAYGRFFHVNKRYAAALNYPNDPYKFAVEIKKAGYATDPDYTSKIHSLLNKYYA